MRLNLYLVLVCSLLYEVEGWPCVPPVRKVYSKAGTNAVLRLHADLSNQKSPRSFEVQFHDNTSICRIRYAIDKTTSGSCVVGVSFTGDSDGNVAVTLQNVQLNNTGIYSIVSAGLTSRCNCLYILGVPTKPVITVNKTPSVGDISTLTCSSISTTSPSDHSLTMVYTWKVGNDDITTGTKYSYSTDTKNLYISNIVKEDATKQFTCTAREDVLDGYTSNRSDAFSFDVYYGPENLSLSPSDSSYEKEENSILSQITCNASCHPTCSFRWTKVGQVTDVSNTAVLDMGSLSATKSGTYICTATSSNSATQSMNFTVNVIYGPRNMTFSPSTLSYIRDENFNLPPITCGAECWSCGYSWTGPNFYSTTGQVLDLPGLTKSMAGSYTCSATNTKLSPQRQQDKIVQIGVRYGPDSASFTPGNTIHTIDEGSILSDIKCEADCFPACKYRWIKGGQTVSNTDMLTFGQVKKSDAGTYTCKAINGDDDSRWLNKSVTIEVRYGPYQSSTNLSLPTQQYTMNEGHILQDITCSADCFPTCTYSWTKTKQGQTTTVSSTNVLSLASLHRDKAATYTCTAVNPGKSLSPKTTKQIIVQVRYGPDVANVNVQSPYYVTEGDTNIEIKCSSDCFPGCSYTWSNLTSGSIISSNNSVLSLSSVTRYMTGNYRCDSSNTASQYSKSSMSTVNTVVKYAPDVTIQLLESNHREGDSLTLYCNGSGVPSNYTYISFKQSTNGVEIQNPNTELTGTPMFSSIHFISLKYQDTGTYTCTLNNGINDIYGSLNQVGASDLLVKVKPKVLKDDLRFTGSTGATIDIVIPIYSYPKLESLIITRYDGMDDLSGLDYVIEGVVTTTFYGKDVSVNGSRVNMTMNDLKEEDFGNYTFTLQNALGSTDIVIFIIAEGPPSPPKVFQFLSDHSIPTFLWERNFNGGLLQSFVIQISVAGTDMWTNHTNIIETDKQYQINSSFHNANISGLQPGFYTARILAYNTEGESETVHLNSTFEVKILSGDGPTSAPIAAIAAGGTGSAIVVIAIVAVVLFVFKRRSKDKDGSRTKLSSRNHEMHDDDDDEDEVNTVNPMYVSADEVQSTDNTYVQPIKKKNTSDASNVYAVVDKKKTKDKKENIKKKKNKKAVEGDIYENAPDPAISMNKIKTGKKQAYDENPYENPESSGAKQSKRFVNQDGLIYADLAFNDQLKGQKKLVIHGLDSMTEYVEVDFTKRADPLPDSDEEDNKNKT